MTERQRRREYRKFKRKLNANCSSDEYLNSYEALICCGCVAYALLLLFK